MTYISVHADKSALASTLCATIVAQSVEAIQDHGVYLLAVSGGSIPKMLSHSNLSAAFTSAGVEMNLSKWTVFLADERIVAVDSLDSNLLALRKDGFIGGVDGQEERCRCFGIEGFGEKSPSEIASAYETTVKETLQSSGGKFDTIVLGMGEDGHTCSLFPGHDLVLNPKAGKMVDFLTDSPKPPPSRITLTLDVLNSSRHCIFAAAGGGKSKVLGEVFSKVLEEEDVVEGRRNLKCNVNETSYPCAMVNSEDMLWLVDEGAASEIQ